LAHVREAGPGQRPADPRLELPQVVRGGRVVEGEHRNLVLDRLEDVGGHTRDALGRTVAGDQVGEARLELAQLPREPVVLGVGDLGARLDVVQGVVVVDLLAQRGDPLRRIGPGHEGEDSRSRFGSFLAAPGRVQLYSTRRADGEVLPPECGEVVHSQDTLGSEGRDRLRPGLPGRDLRPPVEREARHRRAARQAHGDLGAGRDRGDSAARPGPRGSDRRRRAHHRGGGGGQEAARAPLEERRAPGPPAEDHRGGAVGRDDHRGERRSDDHAGATGGCEDLGLPAEAVKVTFWLLVAIGAVYVLYTGGVAAHSYFQVKALVEDTLVERAKVDRYERANRVQQDILRKASQSGVPLHERDVSVAEENRTLRVQIRWSYPMFFYKGEAVLSMPLSYDKRSEERRVGK